MDPNQEVQQQMQKNFERYMYNYNVNLKFPANLTSQDPQKKLRTNADLIQIRLLEAGVLYENPQPVAQTAERLGKFVAALEKTGCFHNVNVEVDELLEAEPPATTAPAVSAITGEPLQHRPTQQLNVVLNEKNWYRLYMGGGIRNDMSGEIGGNLLSKTQFETSAGLNNLTGYLDTTAIQYTVDATSNSRWDFQHIRPLDAYTPDILHSLLDVGTYSLGMRASMDTLDYEWTRSYKERQRKMAIKISNHEQVAHPEMSTEAYSGCEWSWLFRDIIPRRHATLPYALDASSEIAAQSGPSEKHAIALEYRTNGIFCDDKYNPSEGIDYYSKLEVAGPPGDTGFVKAQGGGTLHLPLLSPEDNSNILCSLHGSLHTGMLQSLSFGGACKPATISDRFFVGGPMQLRGFCPAGIGPRAKTGSATAPQGDALGGEFFYTATLAASMTTPYLNQYGLRFLAFGNVGTLAGSLATAPSWTTIAKSSRASVGVGACVGTPMGRIELTYAWPMRYGPRDARKNVQFGLGFSFG